MSEPDNSVDRRDFLKTAGGVGLSLGVAGSAFAAARGAKMSGRVIGANDRINVGVIGVGGRGNYVAADSSTNSARRTTMPARSWPSATSTKSARRRKRTGTNATVIWIIAKF